MTKEGYTEIQIPTEEYDEMTKEAKKLGFKNLDEFIGKAVEGFLEKEKQKRA